jgi:RNA polymerase sigma-70 factor (ECF subfamily)
VGQAPRILALYQAHRVELVRYASTFAGSRAQAEDVVQEAWLRLGRLRDIDLIHEPVGYLYRMVRNLAIDAYRTRARETARSEAEGPAAAMADERPSPEQTILAKDELRIVLDALADLPERVQVAVRMNRMEGRKLQEVADFLGLSVTRTHVLISEAVAYCDQRRTKAQKR